MQGFMSSQGRFVKVMQKRFSINFRNRYLNKMANCVMALIHMEVMEFVILYILFIKIWLSGIF